MLSIKIPSSCWKTVRFCCAGFFGRDALPRVRSSVGTGSCRSANVLLRLITAVYLERHDETAMDGREPIPTEEWTGRSPSLPIY
jgi:hypothetical protein